MRFFTFLFIGCLFFSCNISDEVVPAADPDAFNMDFSGYFTPDTDYTFVSLVNPQQGISREVSFRFNDQGAVDVRHRLIRAQRDHKAQSIAIAPAGGISAISGDLQNNVPDQIQINEEHSHYWIIPFSNPAEAKRVRTDQIDFFCGSEGLCPVQFRVEGSMVAAICNTERTRRCGLMSTGYLGNPDNRGGVLIVKARDVNIW